MIKFPFLDIAVRTIEKDEWPILGKRLAAVLLAAFKESNTIHLKQNRSLIIIAPNKTGNPFRVEVRFK